MEITISEDNWTAYVLLSPVATIQTDHFLHLQARVIGKSQEHALAGAQAVLDLFGKGRELHFRERPHAATETEYKTKKPCYHGYVRFAFKLQSGVWHEPEPPSQYGFGSVGL